MQSLLQDLRYAARMLRKNPGFTLIAVFTLALGIGANTAIFSVVHAFLLRPLPYEEPQCLAMVWESVKRQGEFNNTVSPSNFNDWREQSTSFDDMAAYFTQSFTLTESGEPEKVEGAVVTDNLLNMLGVQASSGRVFERGDPNVEFMSAALISHGLWQRRFAGSHDLIGQTIMLDGRRVPVIGIMPPWFQFPTSGIDVWAPFKVQPAASRVEAHFLQVLGRIKPGVGFQQAQAEMDSVAAQLEQKYPQTNRNVGIRIIPLQEQITGNIRSALLVLFAAAGFVLLIACANVANLMLARTVARQREMAIRLAMGAGRLRLVTQMLTESLLLGLMGSAAGLLLALWGVPLLASFIPAEVVPLTTVSIDLKVLLFTLLLSLATGLVFGLLPALRSTRLNLSETLKKGSGNSRTGRSGLQSLLVISEVALTLVLLAGAGLLFNSFLQLTRVDPGFKTDDLLTMEVSPSYTKYPDVARRAGFYDELIERVQSLPGVKDAAVVTRLPLKPQRGKTTFLTGGPGEMTFITEQQGEPRIYTAVPRVISSDYFGTMGIPILAGRSFDEKDIADSPGVAIISQSMAARSWPGEDSVGKRLIMGVRTNPWLIVVGVAGDVRHSLDVDPRPHVYLPYTQTTFFNPQDLVIRAEVDPLSLADSVRKEVWSIDEDLPITGVGTMSHIMSESVARQRFNLLLMGIFAALSLLLAAGGLFGVTSYLVAQSTREIGIRMALGAQSRDVMKIVIAQGMTLTVIGMALGLLTAFILTRMLSGMLYGVSATDPLTLAAVAAVLGLVALLACYAPARRATKIDPIIALRYE